MCTVDSSCMMSVKPFRILLLIFDFIKFINSVHFVTSPNHPILSINHNKQMILNTADKMIDV